MARLGRITLLLYGVATASLSASTSPAQQLGGVAEAKGGVSAIERSEERTDPARSNESVVAGESDVIVCIVSARNLPSTFGFDSADAFVVRAAIGVRVHSNIPTSHRHRPSASGGLRR